MGTKKRSLLLFIFLAITTTVYAAQRMTLQDGSGNEIGTSANPVKISLSGDATTRFLVCSSSADVDSGLCDYVCDGTADDVQIQQAHDDMQSTNPGIIQFTEGQFNIAATINVTKPRIILRGQGKSTRLQMANSADVDMISVAYATENAFFSIEDMWMHGNKDNNTTGRGIYANSNVKDVNILDSFVSHFSSEGLEVDNAWGLVLQNSIFEFMEGDAIVLNGGTNPKIINCKIKSNDATGIQYDANVDYGNIIGNEFDAPVSDFAIILDGEGTVVSNNDFHDGTVAGSGIQISSDLSIIANNKFRGSSMVNAINLTATANYNNLIGNEFFISNTPISDSGGDNYVIGRDSANGTGTLIIDGGASNILELNPKAGNNVEFFAETDVGDANDGKHLIIHRKAAEGDDDIDIYTANNRLNVIASSNRLWIDAESSTGIHLNPNASTDISMFSSSAVGENRNFDLYGYITTAADEEYVRFNVDDSTDTFIISRESTYVDGMQVQMPLIPNKVTGDPCSTSIEGAIFYNDTADELCFCDASGVDLRVKDATTACF